MGPPLNDEKVQQKMITFSNCVMKVSWKTVPNSQQHPIRGERRRPGARGWENPEIYLYKLNPGLTIPSKARSAVEASFSLDLWKKSSECLFVCTLFVSLFESIFELRIDRRGSSSLFRSHSRLLLRATSNSSTAVHHTSSCCCFLLCICICLFLVFVLACVFATSNSSTAVHHTSSCCCFLLVSLLFAFVFFLVLGQSR